LPGPVPAAGSESAASDRRATTLAQARLAGNGAARRPGIVVRPAFPPFRSDPDEEERQR